MSETAHTPGPWRALEHNYPIADTGDYDGAWLVLTDNPKRPIVELWGDTEETEANARLIAAAPDLLAALQFVMTAHGEQLSTAFEQAQDAIAKATGVQA